MKLKEVKHNGDLFTIYSNRFVLFDKNGNRLNSWAIKELPNYEEIEVLETKESGYQSYVYFVGFSTTHIKLNLFDPKLLDPFRTIRFGEVEEDKSY